MHLIATVPADRRFEAMRLIRPETDASALTRFLDHLDADPRLAQHALGASQDDQGRYRSAVLVLPSPGHTVTYCFASRRATAPTICHLTQWALETTPPHLAELAQTLLPVHATAMLEGVQQAGMTHLADLHHMHCAIRPSKTEATWPEELQIQPASDAMLMDLLPQTYAGTLDCPALRGLRRTADIVAGHRAGGQCDPELWIAVFDQTQPLGCVLVTLAPDRTADLAYIGLIPSARGRGLGKHLMRAMLNRLAQRDIRSVRLAVDAKNTPALKLYRQLGFRRIGMQRAAIRSLRKVQPELKNTDSSTSH